MDDIRRTVTVIPAKPQMDQQEVMRQLRVAAYCRVSTAEEEQQSSYEAQCTYYTDKIMTNPEWTMAGVFADEGISGTSTKNRDDFNRMIRRCRQRKIDLIHTKSISRFARNTVDSLKYIRALKGMGIGIIFEKENINTLEMDTELILTFMSAFAQSESESISANVRWGKRQAMKEGKASINFRKLYGYYLDDEGNPQVDSDKAEAIRSIFDQYLQGASLMRNVRSRRIDTARYVDCGTKNNLDLVQWAISACNSGWGYVMGTFGQLLTVDLLEAKLAQLPDAIGPYEDYIRANYLGVRTADCIGLIKGYSWYDPDTGNINYKSNGMPDVGADQIYDQAAERGSMATMPEIPGLILHASGHVGIYIGNG